MDQSTKSENLHGQYERFETRLIYNNLSGQRIGDSERSDTDCFFLNSREMQKIISEVQVKSHLWSVIGVVVQERVRPAQDTIYFDVGLYAYVKPALDAEESATLEVRSRYSQPNCFKIVPSTVSCCKYGPSIITITIPEISKIIDFGKLTLTLGTEKVSNRNCVSLTEKQPHPAPMNSFLEYSKALFQNHELSDVTLKICGKEFPAHKLLLSSLSPVFKTMFLSDFRESGSNVVEIEDFEFEVIREMLKFIYTHQRPQFRSSKSNIDTVSLYKASHKYEIQYLLDSCRQELLSTINIKGALDVLLLADIYDDALLKEKVLDFICRNPPAVEDVSKCEEVVRQRPGLLKNILTCKFQQK